ncbi:uncharacterized protein LOC144128168 [Amblyomma americanum]
MEATNPDVVPASPSSSPRAEHNVGVEDCETGIAVQTDLKMGDIEALENECVALNERLYASRTENKLLELTEDALKCSDAKVVFYTAGLAAIFTHMTQHSPQSIRGRVTGQYWEPVDIIVHKNMR